MNQLTRLAAGLALLFALAPVSLAATVSGQVFIVTKGQQAVKLPLVSISAIPEAEVKRVMSEWAKETNETRKHLAEAIREIEKIRDAANETAKPVLEQRVALRSEIRRRTENCLGRNFSVCVQQQGVEQLRSEANEYDASTASIVDERDKALKLHREAVSQYKAASSYQKFFDAMVAKAKSTTTIKSDADGKFTIAVKGKVALIASVSRQVLDDREDYRWLVWAPRKGGNVSVQLANDNMLETFCETCVNYLPLLETYGIE